MLVRGCMDGVDGVAALALLLPGGRRSDAKKRSLRVWLPGSCVVSATFIIGYQHQHQRRQQTHASPSNQRPVQSSDVHGREAIQWHRRRGRIPGRKHTPRIIEHPGRISLTDSLAPSICTHTRTRTPTLTIDRPQSPPQQEQQQQQEHGAEEIGAGGVPGPRPGPPSCAGTVVVEQSPPAQAARIGVGPSCMGTQPAGHIPPTTPARP